ncbi:MULTISPECIES: LTA synthase family protein [Nocardioides]|uniref:LTA synthase family protein n=1 Tax=Nocardioides vastitatis TaxID=2568655 RepID=A0ABW0ZGU4_9ACTN|nr:LTA synthase family protein [Nocardioides sp.]THI92998.1 LTA synthase family protein [Nocardioides sp.]
MSSLARAERAGEEQPEAPAALEAPQPAPLRTVLGRGALGTLQAAVVATLLLQASTFALFYPRWLKDQLIDGVAFYADTLVIWLVLLLLWSVLGRLWWSIGILIAIVITVGIANIVKMRLREEPVYPSDLHFASEPEFLTSMVSPLLQAVAVAVSIGTVVWAMRIGRRMDLRYPRPSWRRLPRRQAVAVLGLRLAVAVITGPLLLQTAQFNHPGSYWRGIYEVRGDHWRYWNQKTNYRANGFVGGFLFNMPVDAMREPMGYDQAAMDEIADRYERVAERINAGRTGSLDDVNVVLVLSESFTDPTELDGFELERDPIPRTRARMAETTSGHMLAQMYGGGTANMEFEVLTGQSLGLFRAQMLSPYQMLVPEQTDYPSAVGWLTSRGHEAIAIHPYREGMYKRKQVYGRFGFESFIHAETIGSTDTIEENPYISDDAAFDEVLRRIDDQEKPLLVNLVTMQNHIPVEDNYEDPIEVRGAEGGQAERIGQYARGLEYTDQALDSFLETLEESDEKTIVLFYGDHLPGIYGSSLKNENRGLPLYRTPFFIWSNQPGQNRARTVPITSPAFFLPLVYEVADAPVPPFLALLDRVHREVAVIQQGRLLDDRGESIAEAAMAPEVAQLLEDLRLVQFDFSIGGRFGLDRMWPGSASERPKTPK